jgi:predicted O-linked N-acetylglucosamine transferase (SPINDLY family)
MGCPLVTVRGATLAGRLGAAMLESAGVPELVADSVDGFVATAIALAVDAERRRTLRERLLRHRGSAASSATTFARRLEHAFRVAVDRHAAGLEPAHIDVPATVS